MRKAYMIAAAFGTKLGERLATINVFTLQPDIAA